jgi:hypothetical protein
MTKKKLPHKPLRSQRSEKTDRGKRVVENPMIKVVVGKNEYGYDRLSDAHLLIRGGCYQYLRWRDGRKIREFYLGKVKIRATHRSSCSSPAPAGRCVVRKAKFKVSKYLFCPALFSDEVELRNRMVDDHSDDSV